MYHLDIFAVINIFQDCNDLTILNLYVFYMIVNSIIGFDCQRNENVTLQINLSLKAKISIQLF